MRNTLKSEKLLQSIQQSYSVIKINNTPHDVDNIIKNMATMIQEPPDFVCGKDTYLEHFEVDAYQREEIKEGKLSSTHRSNEANMNKRASSSQSIFSTTHYSTPPSKSNTRYLKENIDTLISEKTGKQDIYEKNCPNAKNKHLLIELKSRCELILGDDGQYLDAVPKKEPHEKQTEFYEVYKDKNFIKALKERYFNEWDLLIFIDEFCHYDTHIFYLYCIDLKEDIVPRNMKTYPEKLYQIITDGIQMINFRGGNMVTNIQYIAESDDSSGSFLWSYNGETISINEIVLYKSRHDSVYMTRDEGLQFETSQKVFAINPDVSVEIMIQYIPVLLKEKLNIKCEDIFIELKRITSIDSYFFSYGKEAAYRIDDKKNLVFKLFS